jgi:hypothetical protein
VLRYFKGDFPIPGYLTINTCLPPHYTITMSKNSKRRNKKLRPLRYELVLYRALSYFNITPNYFAEYNYDTYKVQGPISPA